MLKPHIKVNMDRVNCSTSMYSGKTENETYSISTTSAVSGSYYDHIKEEAAIWIDKIIHRLDLRGQVVIADYGTADGIGFLSMMNSLLEKHIQGLRDIDFMIYLNDQPSNDFNLLIKGLAEPATINMISGPGLCENISAAVIGRSMYERCLPKNSLDICFSTTALHWLTQKPCDVKNGLTHKQACKEEKKAFQEQAKHDWHQFLVNRGKELNKGGLCVILCLTDVPEDDSYTHPYVLATHIWERLLNSGIITKDEFVKTTVQAYLRRPEDFSYPFDHDDQDIAYLGLRLLSSIRVIHKYTEMKNNYFKTEEEHKKKYADAIVGFIQPFLRNTIYSGLSNGRSEESRNAICDEFFQIMWKMAYRKEIKVPYTTFQQIVIQKS